MIMNPEMISAEVKWQVIGERLSDGGTLYQDVWDDIAPLSAGIYWIKHLVFGRSVIISLILSFLLVFYQSYIFNDLLIRNNIYPQSTYLPAFFYGMFMSSSFDMFYLSPPVIGMTLLIPALNNIYSHTQFRTDKDEKILNIGLLLSIATLCYLPFFVFFLLTLFTFVFFTGTVFRRYILITYGYLIPLLLSVVYFLLNGTLSNYIDFFFGSVITVKSHLISSTSFLFLFVVPFVLILLAILKFFRRSRFSNYQISISQIMMIWLMVLGGTYYFLNDFVPYTAVLFAPIAAFFITHYFLSFRNKFFASLLFFAFLGSLVLVNLGSSYGFLGIDKIVDFKQMYIKPNQIEDIHIGKKIFFAGDNIDIYYKSRSGSPFLDWSLASSLFENPDDYYSVNQIYRALITDIPDVIIDPDDLIAPFLERMPAIKETYEKLGDTYYLKSN